MSELQTSVEVGMPGNVSQVLRHLPNPFIRTEQGLQKQATGALNVEIEEGIGATIAPGKLLITLLTGDPVPVGQISLNGVDLPASTVSVTGRKKVVSTALAGVDIAVHEIVSIEEWEVKIVGYVQDEFGEYPIDRIRDFAALFRINTAVEVACDLLQALAIDAIVLTSVNFPPLRGNAAFQYEFTGLADRPVELETDLP